MPDTPIVARLRAAGCVFAEDEALLILETATTPAQVEGMVARRVTGEPLELVLGWAEFCGARYAVAPGVFVPRQRTAFLVTQAVARGRRGAVVVDLCCGCGAIGATVAAALPRVELHAADVDPAAVACARHNLAGVGEVHEGDLDAPLPAHLRGRVDLLVANVPYVPTWAIPRLVPEARDYEPHIALDGGPDGLDVLRRLVAVAPRWLTPGGYVLAEADERQADAALSVVGGGELEPELVADPESTTIVVIGRKREPTAPAGPDAAAAP